MTPQESEELAVLWTGAQPVVAAFIRSIIPSHDESEELLQETAVVAVRRFHKYDRQRPFVGWAIGIAKMKVLTHQRKKARGQVVFDGALVEQIAEDYRELAKEHLPIHKLLIRCIAELEARAREAIRMRYTEQMKTPQIAAALELSHAAARTLLTRARIAIRLCVEKHSKDLKA